MKYFTTSIGVVAALLVTSMIVSGCDKADQPDSSQVLEKISAGDECHVCGMEIIGFPGPKAQAFVRHQNAPLKFCSTIELFAWLLQPDTKAILHSAYVHDMGAAGSWDKPSDEHYVNAHQAWYVVGHSRLGAMGLTLASFQKKQDAENFIEQYGGRLLDFNAIDLELLAELRMRHADVNNQRKP
ncbi:nitrous oxide reductase accessory protein NosL [Sulfuriflexus mobilis]|uniref:nitrous oxide reductase accessory protein NosL n=1 Tax=Sulfuriflexus mobilis TaxID=1811807 RepID=UPI000F83D8E7|nr:nitrous oxide reductase accessory protein NosL [Sulfuriflexus mobilis]